MYLGHVVEMGTTDQVFAPPYHPYTEALLSAVPIADTSITKEHIVLDGDIPSAMNPPSDARSKRAVVGRTKWTGLMRTRGAANSHHGKRTSIEMPLGSISAGRNDTCYQNGS